MDTIVREWSASDSAQYAEFVRDEQSQREERGRVWEQAYAEGIRVGLNAQLDGTAGFFQ